MLLNVVMFSPSKMEIIPTLYLASYSGHVHSIELAKGFGLCIFHFYLYRSRTSYPGLR